MSDIDLPIWVDRERSPSSPTHWTAFKCVSEQILEACYIIRAFLVDENGIEYARSQIPDAVYLSISEVLGYSTLIPFEQPDGSALYKSAEISIAFSASVFTAEFGRSHSQSLRNLVFQPARGFCRYTVWFRNHGYFEARRGRKPIWDNLTESDVHHLPSDPNRFDA